MAQMVQLVKCSDQLLLISPFSIQCDIHDSNPCADKLGYLGMFYAEQLSSVVIIIELYSVSLLFLVVLFMMDFLFL
jgi:hypothetical protein